MSGHFEAAFSDLMFWEGGARYHKVQGDAGGATKYGVSLRFLRTLPLDQSDITGDGHVTEADIAALTEDKARGFYLKHFWLHYQLQSIHAQTVATKLLNMFVNMRGNHAARLAQRALATCGIFDVKEDGYIGPFAQAAINDLTAVVGGRTAYLAALRAHQECFYRLIVAADPTQEKFLNGWLRRARDQK